MQVSEAFDFCKKKTIAAGSSFYYSFKFLPKNKYQAMLALYAFCREVDDIVDEPNNTFTAQQKLNWWHQEITNAYSLKAQHPIAIALQHIIIEFKLPEIYFHELIDAMGSDLIKNSYNNFSELKKYCYGAASTVGILSSYIFGFTNKESTIEYATNLGIAMQLINIIRDVGEDLRNNRIYLPQDELQEYNINLSLNNIDKLEDNNQNWLKFMQFQTNRAHNYYNQALQIIKPVDRINQTAALIMAKIYIVLLNEINNSKFKVLKQKIKLTPLRKLWIAWWEYSSERKFKRKFYKQNK